MNYIDKQLFGNSEELQTLHHTPIASSSPETDAMRPETMRPETDAMRPETNAMQMMNYTDEQLKRALTKMLPECIHENGDLYIYDADFGSGGHRQVFNTELLYLCWLAEKTLSPIQTEVYEEIFELELCLYAAIHASWEQRVEALAKVKGIEI